MNNSGGLHVESVSHRFGDVEAVSDVSLTVSPGEIHCLLGPSGSGKSTLLRVIAGLERQQKGAITIEAETVSDGSHHQPAEQRSVGFVFQDYALFPHLSARDNVLFGMSNRRSAESRSVASQLLADVGLANHEDSMPHTLSGGEQQRVALARAMARTPKIMLLDEPFSGLDVQLRSDVRETTLRVLRAANVATVMVTHDPSEAISCADRISVMHCGNIVQTDEPNRIYYHPSDARTAETFGLVNQIPIESRDGRLMTPYGEWTSDTASDQSVVYVRPEQLTIEPSVDDGEPNRLHIERVIHEGSTTLYVVTASDGTRLYIRTLSTEALSPGAAMHVRLRSQ